jgi:hypothetical protein
MSAFDLLPRALLHLRLKAFAFSSSFSFSYLYLLTAMARSSSTIRMLRILSRESLSSVTQPPLEMQILIYMIVNPRGHAGGVFPYPREAAKSQQLGHLAGQKCQLQASLYTIDSVKLPILWLFSMSHLGRGLMEPPSVECYLSKGGSNGAGSQLSCGLSVTCRR